MIELIQNITDTFLDKSLDPEKFGMPIFYSLLVAVDIASSTVYAKAKFYHTKLLHVC